MTLVAVSAGSEFSDLHRPGGRFGFLIGSDDELDHLLTADNTDKA
jgi:hypothetical protein